MNVLDLLLVLAVVSYAFSGYRMGFLVGASTTIGLLVGGFVGVLVTPAVLDQIDPSLGVSVAALVIVLVARDASARRSAPCSAARCARPSPGGRRAPSTQSAARRCRSWPCW